jgi:hypothetical protein
MMIQASALVLGAAALAVWFVAPAARAAARLQLRFAAILFVAPACAAVFAPTAAAAVTLITLPIALAVLALACAAGFERIVAPSLAAVALAVVCLGGLGAAVTGLAAFALAPTALGAVAIAALSIRQFDTIRPSSVRGLLSAACFLAATSAFALEGVGAPLLLFLAAGLLGLTLALSRSDAIVDEKPGRDLRVALPVRGRRQA